jgi:hypothetical protein
VAITSAAASSAKSCVSVCADAVAAHNTAAIVNLIVTARL